MMKKYYFNLHLTYHEFLPYYEGQVHAIVVRTTDGIRIQFPASHIRKYVTSTGIRGYFCMNTENNKFLSITKIS